VVLPADLSLVFVLGGPGSGKGTQCERISKNFGYTHLSTGDLIRAEIKAKTPLGEELEKITASGALVSTDIVLTMLKNAMGGTKLAGRYLIDGFPRALDQVTLFEEQVTAPTMVLAFDAAEAVLEERLVARGKASGRADDNVESIRKRFATFKSQSEPVINFYSEKRPEIVKKLNSERPIDEVYADVVPLFTAEVARIGGTVAAAPAQAAPAAAAPAPAPAVASISKPTSPKVYPADPVAAAAAAPAAGGGGGGCCTIA
jgi:adenylate kinase family enzyme